MNTLLGLPPREPNDWFKQVQLPFKPSDGNNHEKSYGLYIIIG